VVASPAVAAAYRVEHLERQTLGLHAVYTRNEGVRERRRRLGSAPEASTADPIGNVERVEWNDWSVRRSVCTRSTPETRGFRLATPGFRAVSVPRGVVRSTDPGRSSLDALDEL